LAAIFRTQTAFGGGAIEDRAARGAKGRKNEQANDDRYSEPYYPGFVRRAAMAGASSDAKPMAHGGVRAGSGDGGRAVAFHHRDRLEFKRRDNLAGFGLARSHGLFAVLVAGLLADGALGSGPIRRSLRQR